MNSNNPDSTDRRKEEALKALMSQDGQSDGGDPQGVSAAEDPFARLEQAAQPEPDIELIDDDEPAQDDAQGFLKQMAQESNEVSPELSMLRSMVTSGAGGGISISDDPLVTPQFDSAAGQAFAAPQPSRRAAMLQANARKANKHAFKQFMIPLLIVVGGLLILLSVITMVMLATGEEGSAVQDYGKFFIVAALPVGAILIMGAWLFFLDTRKSR